MLSFGVNADCLKSKAGLYLLCRQFVLDFSEVTTKLVLAGRLWCGFSRVKGSELNGWFEWVEVMLVGVLILLLVPEPQGQGSIDTGWPP